jgi:hypothetical protein
MTTKKKNTTNQPSYETITAVRLRDPTIDTSGKKPTYILDYVGTDHFGHTVPCTKQLYTAVTEDSLHQNYRVMFRLHQNDSNKLVEYITTEPKDIYGAYEVEYEEDISLPNKDVYREPE